MRARGERVQLCEFNERASCTVQTCCTIILAVALYTTTRAAALYTTGAKTMLFLCAKYWKYEHMPSIISCVYSLSMHVGMLCSKLIGSLSALVGMNGCCLLAG